MFSFFSIDKFWAKVYRIYLNLVCLSNKIGLLFGNTLAWTDMETTIATFIWWVKIVSNIDCKSGNSIWWYHSSRENEKKSVLTFGETLRISLSQIQSFNLNLILVSYHLDSIISCRTPIQYSWTNFVSYYSAMFLISIPCPCVFSHRKSKASISFAFHLWWVTP